MLICNEGPVQNTNENKMTQSIREIGSAITSPIAKLRPHNRGRGEVRSLAGRARVCEGKGDLIKTDDWLISGDLLHGQINQVGDEGKPCRSRDCGCDSFPTGKQPPSVRIGTASQAASNWVALAVLASVAALPLANARAQDRPVGSPESLVQTIEPQGVPLGDFVLYPRVSAYARYDTNVYNRPDGEDDTVFVVRPSVRVAADLARHALEFNLAAEGRRYVDNTGENSEQWSASTLGRLDLANRFELTATAGIAERIERRGTLGDDFLTDEPVTFRELGAGLGIARRGGIMEWEMAVASRKIDYDDATLAGVPIDQSPRDVRRDSVTWRGDYRGFSRLGLMARVTGTRLAYDQLTGRNSKGFSVLGGITYRVTDLVNVEAGIGFVHHDPADPLQPKINALDYSVAGTWTPTPRVQFAVLGARSVERSPLPGAFSVLESNLEAEATVAVGDRLIAGLRGGVEREEYRGIDRRQTRYFAEATARYLVTPRWAAFVGAGWRRQDTSGINPRTYGGATLRGGVTLAF
jgi:hypothetical protein